jgi:nucleoid DNA-binding protein
MRLPDCLPTREATRTLREATPSRNPQTGEETTISARRVVSFRASAVLRTAVNCEK